MGRGRARGGDGPVSAGGMQGGRRFGGGIWPGRHPGDASWAGKRNRPTQERREKRK